MEESIKEKKKEQSIVKTWLDRYSEIEKSQKEYKSECKKIKKAYRKENNGQYGNLFWANIEFQLPYLYSKKPKPYIEQRFKNGNPTERMVCDLLEKCLTVQMDGFDFDNTIKMIVRDFCLYGKGVPFIRYSADVIDIEEKIRDDGIVIEESMSFKENERTWIDYIPYDRFYCFPNKGTWEDQSGIMIENMMTKREALDRFGKVILEFKKQNEEDQEKDPKCYKIIEVWDKTTKSVYWISEDYKEGLLDTSEDPFKFEGFFPCPRPLLSNITNDELTPVPDYVQYKDRLNKIDRDSKQKNKLSSTIRKAGVYDQSIFNVIADLYRDPSSNGLFPITRKNEEVSSITLQQAISWLDMTDQINSVMALRNEIEWEKNQIFEETGLSDIMRGNSNPNDTASAVNKKAYYGTMRIQDKQIEIQRVLRDLIKMMAYVISELFDEETILKMTGYVPPKDPEQAMEQYSSFQRAIQLLRNDKLRCFLIDVETDITSIPDTPEEQAAMSKIIGELSGTVAEIIPYVKNNPETLDFYENLILQGVRNQRAGRVFENSVSQMFDKIRQQIQQDQQQTEQPDPAAQLAMQKVQAENMRTQTEQMKAETDKMYKQGQLSVKEQELALKKEKQDVDAMLTAEEIDAQERLGMAKIEANANVNPTITTGFVRPF